MKNENKKVLVTGGTGFIGSSLVRRLVHEGYLVVVFDNNSRGSAARLNDVMDKITFIEGDIRDKDAVDKACEGVGIVHHLAYINGTEFFYTKPELVLEIAVKGMMNVLDACISHGIREFYLASSSEAYQTPPSVPTDEQVPLSVPDPLNPRYSYGGGKIACELLAINYGRKHFDKMVVYRPHNVYGPDMGTEHVVPQFIMRMHTLVAEHATAHPQDAASGKATSMQGSQEPIPFPIQGTGHETRSFIFIDDFVDGIMLLMRKAEHLNIYHIGTMAETTMAALASLVGEAYGRAITIVPGQLQRGGTVRRCPDISKMKRLGFDPQTPLADGVRRCVAYFERTDAERAPHLQQAAKPSSSQSAFSTQQRTATSMPQNMTISKQLSTPTSPAIKVNTMGSTSKLVTKCQTCGNPQLQSILFLGYLPPVNKMHLVGARPDEEAGYPAELLYCGTCHLCQLGLIVDKEVLFPSEYPYTSSTTKVLRENFAELGREATPLLELAKDDLIVDIGSNDGNLLSNFLGKQRVLGVTPEEIGKLAIARGIPTIIDYFTKPVVERIKKEYGKAKVVTATNVFAHIDDVNSVVEDIKDLMADDGVFIAECHYLLPFIKTLQYDTIYHEHMRYYSLHSLKYLLESHGLEIFHAKEIPSHGGSIRVYAGRKGQHPVKGTVANQLSAEKAYVVGVTKLREFRDNVVLSKLHLLKLLSDIKSRGQSICAIGAPSRGSTLVSYTGLDDGVIDYVVETKGSHKIGKYLPGTLIPVVEEQKMYDEQPDYALFLSWHIADELVPKIKAKGYLGKFIVPLPEPRILTGMPDA